MVKAFHNTNETGADEGAVMAPSRFARLH